MASRSKQQDEETQTEAAPEEQSATQGLGSMWELDVRKGTRISIERPDGYAVTVVDSLHVLDLPGEYVATYGEGTVLKVTAK